MEKTASIKNRKSFTAILTAFFLILMLNLVAIPLISAAEFDNTYSYNENEGPFGQYTIKDWFGILQLEKVMLTENEDVCEGKCDSKFIINLYQDGSIIDDVRFYDLDTGQPTEINDFKIYIKTGEENITIDEYDYQCDEEYVVVDVMGVETEGYRTVNCSDVYTGSYNETRDIWEEYIMGTEIVSGDYEVRIEGDLKPWQKVDWQILTQGLWSEEWAVWTSNLYDDLVVWYTFEDATSSRVNNSHTNKSYYLNGYNTPTINDSGCGVIGNCVDFERDNTESFDWNTPMWEIGWENMTIGVWIKIESSHQYERIFTFDTSKSVSLSWYNTENLYWSVDGATQTLVVPASTGDFINTWHHVVVTYNGTHIGMWLDGVWKGSQAENENIVSVVAPHRLSGNEGGTPVNVFDGYMDEFFYYNRTLTPAEIAAIYNGGAGLTYGQGEAAPALSNVTLIKPIDNFQTGLSMINFTCNASSSGVNITSMNLWNNKSGTFVITNTTTVANATDYTASWNLTFADGSYDWYCSAGLSNGSITFPSANRSFSLDSSIPQVTLNKPTGIRPYGYTGYSEELNWTITESNIDTIWYVYGGTNTTVTGLINKTNFTAATSPFNITLYANDTFGNINSSTTTWSYKIFNTSESYADPIFEMVNNSYSITLTANSSLREVHLIWNGTSYNTTNSSGTWSYNFTTPIGTGTKNMFWEFIYAGQSINSTAHTQVVNATNFTICGGAGGSIPYINFTFKDENDLSVIQNGTIPSSTWVYYVDNKNYNKTYSFVNNTGNPSYAFCFTPSHKNITMDYTLQYEDEQNLYVQRINDPTALTLTNKTTNTTLYSLALADGIYVTFQVLNQAEQPIPNAGVTAVRDISGTDYEVGSGTTDAAGSLTFFLDSDFEHTFNFTATGYDDYLLSIFPTQSSYTVYMGGSSTSTPNYFSEIYLTTHPLNTTLTNDTAYDFKLVLTSNYWTLDKFGFILYNSTDDEVASASASSNGGTVTANYNVGNTSDYYYMNYYWYTNSTYTNGTRSWYVISSAGTDWSINNFITDFNNYTDSNLFGLGSFGKGLIVFLIIFFFVGIMSYKFGLVSPAGVLTVAFGLVLFFDVGIGMIPNPVGAVTHFPSILMGILLFGVLAREVWR